MNTLKKLQFAVTAMAAACGAWADLPTRIWTNGAHVGGTTWVARNPDATLVASIGGSDRRLIVSRVSDRKMLVRMPFLATEAVFPAAFRSDGNALFVGVFRDGTLFMREINPLTGAKLAELPVAGETSSYGYRRLAVHYKAGVATLYLSSSNRVRQFLKQGSEWALQWEWAGSTNWDDGGFSLSPDGTRFAVARQQLTFFDTQTHAQIAAISLRKPNGNYIYARQIEYSSDGKRLAVATNYGAGTVDDANHVYTAIGTSGFFTAVSWVPGQNAINLVQDRHVVGRVNVANGTVPWYFNDPYYYVNDVRGLPNGGAVTSGPGALRFFGADGKEQPGIGGHVGPVASVAFAGANSVLTASEDGDARIFARTDGTAGKKFQGYRGLSLLGSVATPDGKKVIVADPWGNTSAGNVRVFDAGTGAQLNSAPIYLLNRPERMTVSPKAIGSKGYVLALKDGNQVKLWSLNNYAGIAPILPAESGSIEDVAFSVDGERFGFITSTGAVNLYNTTGWAKVATIKTGLYGGSLAISPKADRIAIFDGRRLLTYVKSGSAYVAEVARDRQTTGSTDRVRFSNDGRHLVIREARALTFYSVPSIQINKVIDLIATGRNEDVSDFDLSSDSTTAVYATSLGEVGTFKIPEARNAVVSLTANPVTIKSKKTSTLTVTLAFAAPAGGVVVTLADNSAKLTTPANVKVGQGKLAASFVVTAGTVAANTKVSVTATVAGTSKKVDLTITK